VRQLPKVTFQVSLNEDMHSAFETVCAKLRLAPTSDIATEFVAAKIMELAKAGLRSDELTMQALRFFEMPTNHHP
jgi:hypothetical protein